MSITEKINHAETTIVDVRTPGEFVGGHVAGSVNIPLNEVVSRIDELKKMQPMVLCCASGGRSGQAADYLTEQGLDVVNGGGWKIVDAHKV
ncbi:MAG: rhodanese-like domain-containing protein [Flavobacteriales bacterium]|jgi:phage shock protein E|tara:strand:- start:652 stop:924 length:273 start_codon:yes stop_codon:yes gene_type:complete